MERRPHYRKGEHLFDCQVCGQTFYSSDKRIRWDGAIVCKEDWEPRHPQDFVRSKPDDQTVDHPNNRPAFQYDEDTYLKAQFTIPASADSNKHLYVDMTSVTNYTIQTGDYLEYDIFYSSDGGVTEYNISVDFTYTDATALRTSGAVDQNGIPVRIGVGSGYTIAPYASGRWYHRKIAMPSSEVGKTVQYYDLVCEKDVAGTYHAWMRNIKITDGNGTTRKNIWSDGDGLPSFAVHIETPAGGTYSITITDTGAI